MALRHFDPSKTFKVVKHFTELGRKFRPGEIYKPRFKASRRVMIRHFITGRIVEVDGQEKEQPKQEEVQKEVVEKVDEGFAQETQDANDEVKVVVDDGEDFQVEYRGVQFGISRNQLRKDGTLTSGGMKAYQKALEE